MVVERNLYHFFVCTPNYISDELSSYRWCKILSSGFNSFMDGSIINIIISVYVTPAVNRRYNGTFLHQHNYIAGLSNLSHSTKETKDGVTPNSVKNEHSNCSSSSYGQP